MPQHAPHMRQVFGPEGLLLLGGWPNGVRRRMRGCLRSRSGRTCCGS